MARVSMFNKSEIDYMTEEQKLARWPNALKLKREIERRREEEFKGKFPKWVSKKFNPIPPIISRLLLNKPILINLKNLILVITDKLRLLMKKFIK
ncbi:hypothetical protein ACLPCX_24850 [Klebsiella pneumoniae]|uniref:hypothetical protein n=1 Tax=Klebsiella pneumoniae TaxID=573 RepID=UPI003D29CC38